MSVFNMRMSVSELFERSLICLSGVTNQPVRFWVPGLRKEDGDCNPVWDKGQKKGESGRSGRT